VHAFFMKKAATAGVDDGTTFASMSVSGLLLLPVAFLMPGGFLPMAGSRPHPRPQVLNAPGALFRSAARL
jgi:hypothetical protein